MSNIIETELVRKKLYDNILGWLSKKLVGLKYKEVYNILLRYIFNKNITKQSTDDPVFITTPSTLAMMQFQKDIDYNKLNINTEEIIFVLEDKLKYASNKVKTTVIKRDKPIEVIPTRQGEEYTLVYRCKKYSDISNLAERYPDYINYALALNIRYTYLHLSNHGLARTFREMGFLPDDDILEGFASAFNHYFDSFCSAFPDLESPFGSKGSFFSNKEWNYSKIFVNPPFDEVLMSETMKRVYSILENSESTYREFYFTIPNWTHYPELEALKISNYTENTRIYKKGELPFIDYMRERKIIYPCEICEIKLSTKVDE